jgi:hypothetical protein
MSAREFLLDATGPARECESGEPGSMGGLPGFNRALGWEHNVI